VLALAALLLGAASAVGTDTDPLAVRSAARNASLTGVAHAFDAYVCAPCLDDPEPLEVVCMIRICVSCARQE
jgi:ribosomal protein L11 methylase PrmA